MSPRSGSRAERLIAAEQASADVLNRAQNVLDVLDNVVGFPNLPYLLPNNDMVAIDSGARPYLLPRMYTKGKVE